MTDQIERRATQKRDIIADRRRIHAECLQATEDVLVDRVCGCGARPNVVRSRANKRHSHGHLLIEIPHNDDRLREVPPPHEPTDADIDHWFSRLIDGQPRNIRLRAIGISRRHLKLHGLRRISEHDIARLDLKPRDSCNVRLPPCPAGNPLAQDAAFGRVLVEPPPAFMRHAHQRFEQQQAGVGVGRIDSASRLRASQRRIIEGGIGPAQRQLKAALAIQVPMTRSRVAAGFGQHGHDLAIEGHISGCGACQAAHHEECKEANLHVRSDHFQKG